MRVALLIVSLCVGLFFLASLLLTFFAREYITRQAQDFVVVRTQRLADPAVALAEQALHAPSIKHVLDEESVRTARQEIAAYHQDPRAYITRLVRGEGENRPAVTTSSNPLRERAARWKNGIQAHFTRTLDRLFWDLRIFLGSNLAASLAAAWCARRANPNQTKWLFGTAGLLLASVAYGTYLYLDGFTYFRILFNTYLGWWYPALLGITFLGLYLEYGRGEEDARRDSSALLAQGS